MQPIIDFDNLKKKRLKKNNLLQVLRLRALPLASCSDNRCQTTSWAEHSCCVRLHSIIRHIAGSSASTTSTQSFFSCLVVCRRSYSKHTTLQYARVHVTERVDRLLSPDNNTHTSTSAVIAGEIMIQLLLLLLTVVSGVLLTPDVVGVRHLVGEPDYRAVRLSWEAFSRAGAARALPPFQVRYCEMQSWGTQRCRNEDVPDLPEPDNNEVPGLANDNIKLYSLDIEGLRMATTYSFEVRPKIAGREDRADDNANDNVIIIPTKGFSARATQCLPHASEIEVSTGPHFAGRITVEASDGERCTVDGETDSPRDTYVLHIDHKECGSFVNETTVATYVIVQENLPILTHSTRRFLVLCSYQPETLTVRAGLSLPTGNSHHHGQGHGSSAPVSQEQDFNSVRRSRQLRPLRLEAQNEDTPEINEEDNVTPVVLLSILTVIGVCGIILVTYRWRRKIKETSDADTESMGSDISISTDMDDNLSNHSSLQFTRPNSLNRNISVHMVTEIGKLKSETLC